MWMAGQKRSGVLERQRGVAAVLRSAASHGIRVQEMEHGIKHRFAKRCTAMRRSGKVVRTMSVVRRHKYHATRSNASILLHFRCIPCRLSCIPVLPVPIVRPRKILKAGER